MGGYKDKINSKRISETINIQKSYPGEKIFHKPVLSLALIYVFENSS